MILPRSRTLTEICVKASKVLSNRCHGTAPHIQYAPAQAKGQARCSSRIAVVILGEIRYILKISRGCLEPEMSNKLYHSIAEAELTIDERQQRALFRSELPLTKEKHRSLLGKSFAKHFRCSG